MTVPFGVTLYTALLFEIFRQFCPEKPFTSVQSSGWQSTVGSFGPFEQPLTLSPCSHEGPVWQVAWAHPMDGNVLASCSYDRKVIIWKEENGTWEKTHEHTGHDSSGTLSVAGEGGGQRGPGGEGESSVLANARLSPCDAPRLSLGLQLLFCYSVHSRGKALRPKANQKQNEKSKDNIARFLVF